MEKETHGLVITLNIWKRLINWIKKEREKWGLNPDTGAIVQKYHTGGIVDGKSNLKSTEVFAKLLKGEFVATESQMNNFMTKTLPSLMNNKPTVTNNTGGDTYSLVLNTNGGNVDKSTYEQLKSEIGNMISTATQNKAMFLKGQRRTAKAI